MRGCTVSSIEFYVALVAINKRFSFLNQSSAL